MRAPKLKYSLVLAVLAVLAGACSASYMADPSAIGVGARSKALGRAFTAQADDVSSLFLNPAGLVNVKDPSFTSMRTTLLGDVGYTVLGFASPVPIGYAGVGIVATSVSGIPLTRWDTGGTVPRPEVYGVTDYGSNVYMFSLANTLGSITGKHDLKAVSVGMTVKYFTQGFSVGSGSMEGSSGSGMDLDVGAVLVPNKAFKAGVFITNLLPMSMGGKFTWKKNNRDEDIPSAFKAGFSYKLIGEGGLRSFGSNEVFFMTDIERPVSQPSRPSLMHSGIEWVFAETISLRLGLDQRYSAAGPAQNDITAGVGIKLQSFSFDYAYHRFAEVPDNSAHFISIGFSYDLSGTPRIIDGGV